MIAYLLRRLLVMIPTLIAISIVAFVIIQLPPGDYLTIYMAQLREQGDLVDELVINRLRQRYGLGQPMYVQYFKWITGILLRNDWGDSMYYNMPVKDVIGDRILLTFILSFSTLIFSWLISIPVGVYSATHQYSIGDYLITAINFIGRGIPEFMLALVIMWWAMSSLGMSVGGLFSPQFITAPWSWAKIVDMLKHIWQPMVILAVGSTAGGIRTTRANLLDELNKPYYELLIKYQDEILSESVRIPDGIKVQQGENLLRISFSMPYAFSTYVPMNKFGCAFALLMVLTGFYSGPRGSPGQARLGWEIVCPKPSGRG